MFDFTAQLRARSFQREKAVAYEILRGLVEDPRTKLSDLAAAFSGAAKMEFFGSDTVADLKSGGGRGPAKRGKNRAARSFETSVKRSNGTGAKRGKKPDLSPAQINRWVKAAVRVLNQYDDPLGKSDLLADVKAKGITKAKAEKQWGNLSAALIKHQNVSRTGKHPRLKYEVKA